MLQGRGIFECHALAAWIVTLVSKWGRPPHFFHLMPRLCGVDYYARFYGEQNHCWSYCFFLPRGWVCFRSASRSWNTKLIFSTSLPCYNVSSPHRSSLMGGQVVFRLRKWYMDCVAEDGTVAIAYWANL